MPLPPVFRRTRRTMQRLRRSCCRRTGATGRRKTVSRDGTAMSGHIATGYARRDRGRTPTHAAARAASTSARSKPASASAIERRCVEGVVIVFGEACCAEVAFLRPERCAKKPIVFARQHNANTIMPHMWRVTSRSSGRSRFSENDRSGRAGSDHTSLEADCVDVGASGGGWPRRLTR